MGHCSGVYQAHFFTCLLHGLFIYLLFYVTELISRNNAKCHHIPRSNQQLSVEIIINENTMAKELINVNKDGILVLRHIGLVKGCGGRPVNQPHLTYNAARKQMKIVH